MASSMACCCRTRAVTLIESRRGSQQNKFIQAAKMAKLVPFACPVQAQRAQLVSNADDLGCSKTQAPSIAATA
eukprot:g12007.t1